MQNHKRISTKSIILTGMFTAVISVLAQISIPLPSGIPITLQTFAVALTGYVLGWKLAGAACTVYLLLGAVGVPVFSNFGAGFGVLFGKTGGFIVGFIFMAMLCGFGIERKEGTWFAPVFGAAGLIVCHLIGIMQFSYLTQAPFWQSALLVSAPYLLKDIVALGLAFVAAMEIRKRLRSAAFASGN